MIKIDSIVRVHKQNVHSELEGKQGIVTRIVYGRIYVSFGDMSHDFSLAELQGVEEEDAITSFMETTLGPQAIARVKAAVRSCPEPSTMENIMTVGGFTNRDAVRAALSILEEHGEISRRDLIPHGDERRQSEIEKAPR